MKETAASHTWACPHLPCTPAGDSADGTLRTASATLAGVRPRQAAVPTGFITRACGATGCAGAKHAGSEPLALSLVRPPAFAAASVAWSRSDGVPIDAASVQGGGAGVVIPPSALPPGGAALTVSATLTLDGASGVTSATVGINAAPYCSVKGGSGSVDLDGNGTEARAVTTGGNGGCLAITFDGNATSYPATFAVAAMSFADDDDGAAT